MFRSQKVSVSKGELSEALYQIDDAKKALYASDNARAVEILNAVDSQLNELLSDSQMLDIERFMRKQDEEVLNA